MEDRSNCREYLRCKISMEASNHSRRCFMTGEYCSQQRNVQQQREKLHKKHRIMAFVVMNFSDMSEVVYKWRISSYVESLAKYLYINETTNELCCSESDKDNIIEEDGWERVESIQVVRADSDPSSNYVICNRICQQMQMADLVIVDVSRQNPNVFYELGMAVSLGKLILPICYSESYYKMSIPEGVKNNNASKEELEHHIGCYPWRKNLFEYYGIRYKENDDTSNGPDKTEYIDYEQATAEIHGFLDSQYERFPYHEKVGDRKIGRTIYDKLRNAYNQAKVENNTLVVYTMEKFMNEEQSGRCIVNFYNTITHKMSEEQCFCGERVGVLVQENFIPEGDKDTKKKSNLFYGIGEIIQIGLNQATYQATERKIQTKDVLELENVSIPTNDNKDELDRLDKCKENIIRDVKEYIRNRGLLVYPNTPIFVNRAKNKFYKELLEDGEDDNFNLYYAMLKTLRYTNEIIVDISNNYEKCLQALFWLGAAHGSDIYAITVLHEETAEEREAIGDTSEKKARNIFDVAGLWMAILRSNDIEGFYEQLALAQQGVENHSKLVLADRKVFDKKLLECFSINEKKEFFEKVGELYEDKANEEIQAMESFYRNRFWKNMLRFNHLNIYLPQEDGETENQEPKAYMVRWDFDAVSELSNYLSKRKPIGEYRIIALGEKKDEELAEEVEKNKKRNFISVGEGAKPLGTDLAEYIVENVKKREIVYSDDGLYKKRNVMKFCNQQGEECRVYKGFKCITNNRKGIYTQHFDMKCLECHKESKGQNVIFTRVNKLKDAECSLKTGTPHTEIAQLILWREEIEGTDKDDSFHVSIVGSSGPASLGATMIFVDEEQKQRYLKDRDKEENKVEFLVELQGHVREEFMNFLIERIMDRIRNIELEQNGMDNKTFEWNSKSYYYLLECAIRAYLSTVLYRYFLPFLSERDIKRIHNGMCAFIDHMKTAGESPFAMNYRDNVTGVKSIVSDKTMDDIIRIIPEELLIMLKAFKGLELFYSVTVENGEIKEKIRDNRSIRNVELYQKGRKKRVNCIYVFGEKI